MKFSHLKPSLCHTFPKIHHLLLNILVIHESDFTVVPARPWLITWMDDQSVHFVLSKSALIPQIQTQVLSHHKKNRQIPCVLLEARQAEGKSLFQQPVMMISHNLGDRLHIGQTRRHPQRERWPAVPAVHTEQIDRVSCRDLGEIFDVCMVIMWTLP